MNKILIGCLLFASVSASADITLKCSTTGSGDPTQTASAVMIGTDQVYDGIRRWEARITKTFKSALGHSNFKLDALADAFIPKDSTPDAQTIIRITAIMLRDPLTETPSWQPSARATTHGQELEIDLETSNAQLPITCKIIKD